MVHSVCMHACLLEIVKKLTLLTDTDNYVYSTQAHLKLISVV